MTLDGRSSLQAGRSFGVNVYLLDGGGEFALLDIGQIDALDDIIDLIRKMDFPLSKCKMIIATHADATTRRTPTEAGLQRYHLPSKQIPGNLRTEPRIHVLKPTSRSLCLASCMPLNKLLALRS